MPNDEPIKRFQPLWNYWVVDAFLGEGSYGRVYRIVRSDLGGTYYSAVKHIVVPKNESQVRDVKSMGLDSASVYSYFQNSTQQIIKEIKLMYALKEVRNIVSYEDYAIFHDSSAAVPQWDVLIRMELLEPLSDYVQRSALTESEIIRLGVEMCAALAACTEHKIIHRDVKESNIFVDEGRTYKLGDFGIARQLSENSHSMSLKGTPNYVAPEIFRNEKYDARVDIYSLGILLYKLLNNGRYPFLPPVPQPITYEAGEAALVRRMRGEALPPPANGSPELAKAVLKACAYRQEERYSTAEEFGAALAACKAGAAIPARPIVEPARRERVPAQHVQPETAQADPIADTTVKFGEAMFRPVYEEQNETSGPQADDAPIIIVEIDREEPAAEDESAAEEPSREKTVAISRAVEPEVIICDQSAESMQGDKDAANSGGVYADFYKYRKRVAADKDAMHYGGVYADLKYRARIGADRSDIALSGLTETAGEGFAHAEATEEKKESVFQNKKLFAACLLIALGALFVIASLISFVLPWREYGYGISINCYIFFVVSSTFMGIGMVVLIVQLIRQIQTERLSVKESVFQNKKPLAVYLVILGILLVIAGITYVMTIGFISLSFIFVAVGVVLMGIGIVMLIVQLKRQIQSERSSVKESVFQNKKLLAVCLVALGALFVIVAGLMPFMLVWIQHAFANKTLISCLIFVAVGVVLMGIGMVMLIVQPKKRKSMRENAAEPAGGAIAGYPDNAS